MTTEIYFCYNITFWHCRISRLSTFHNKTAIVSITLLENPFGVLFTVLSIEVRDVNYIEIIFSPQNNHMGFRHLFPYRYTWCQQHLFHQYSFASIIISQYFVVKKQISHEVSSTICKYTWEKHVYDTYEKLF